MITIHSTVNKEIGSKLQENDKYMLRIQNKLWTIGRETDQSVKIRVELGKLLEINSKNRKSMIWDGSLQMTKRVIEE